MLNHLGDRVYYSYYGWRKACQNKAKALRVSIRMRGNKDIGAAFYINHETNVVHDIGEWDGESGTVYNL